MAKSSRQLDMQLGIYGGDELEVRIGKTQSIIPLQERRCPCGYVFKLANGEIVVGGPRCPEIPGQPAVNSESSWRRSKDGGQTWCESPAWPNYNACQLSDGEIIHTVTGSLVETDQKGVYHTVLYRSTDNGYTHKEETVTVIGIPELEKENSITAILSVPNSPWSKKGARFGYVDHSIVRLRDGSLLAAAIGKFKGDIKERIFVIRSIDRGRTWNYLSTVAFDLTKGKEVRQEGFNEPDLLVLPSGDILCFMRTGGTHNKIGTPLYMSRSKDDGKTWSHADPIADFGVYPKSCLMANGVIAVVYGRPGDWLMFSLDQGETWVGHFCLHKGPEPSDCGNYDWIEEIAPDTLLVSYGRTDPNDCTKTEILGTYITVKPK